MEKYESNVTHPSQIFEDYLKMDVFDKEKFIDMMLSEETSYGILKQNYDDYLRFEWSD